MIVATSQRAGHGRKNSLAVASVAVHVAGALALFGYSLLHIEEIAPPALSLTFFATPPPPPPPPPPAGSSKPKQEKVEVKPVETAKIVDTTEVKPVEKKQEESGGQQGGVEGGVKGGVVGGVVGGVIGGTGTGEAPRMVAAFTLAAQQLQHDDPHLPEWFKQQHATQTVKGVYKVCIGLDGKISSVTVMTPIGAVDDAITDHIKSNWLYKPQAVPVCTASVLVFKIK